MEAFHSLSHLSGGPLLTPAEQTSLSQSLEQFQASHNDFDSQSNSPEILLQSILVFLTPEDPQHPLYKRNAYLHHLNHFKYLEPISHALASQCPAAVLSNYQES
jgi:hypothetical protein